MQAIALLTYNGCSDPTTNRLAAARELDTLLCALPAFQSDIHSMLSYKTAQSLVIWREQVRVMKERLGYDWSPSRDEMERRLFVRYHKVRLMDTFMTTVSNPEWMSSLSG